MTARPKVQDAYDNVIYDPYEAVQALKGETGWTALDLETGGLSPWKDPIAVFSLYGEKTGASAVIHTRGDTPPVIRDFLSEPRRKFVSHNGAGFDYLFLANNGVNVYAPTMYDTLIGEACTIVSQRRDVRVNLQDTLRRRLGVNIKKGLGESPWMSPELTEEQLKYCVEDIQFLPRLMHRQLKDAAADTRKAAIEFEQALAPVVVEMVMNGLPFDQNALDDYQQELELAAEEANERLFTLWGPVNYNSPKQVKEAFNTTFSDELEEPLESTDKLHMNELAATKERPEEVEPGTIGQAADDVLRVRAALKGKGMYSDEWIGKYLHDGRVHPRLWQIGTDTGRFCVAADTRVEMPRDLTQYPGGVPISAVKVGDLVYSFTPDKRLVLRPVKWVGKTGHKQTVKITARCDKHGDVVTFRATPEHLVRLRTGDWRYTGALKVGDRLLCMPHRAVSDEGYAYFSSTSYFRSEGGKYNNPKVKEHRWVMSQVLDRRLNEADTIHHKDENKLNNTPANLERFANKRDHIRHHKATKIADLQAMVDGTAPLTVHPKTLRRLTKRYGIEPTNHTVISVEPGPIEDVWDIEVEDTHTFIGEGVALHNSSSEPNLQQVPKKGRKIFVAPEGYSYFWADYTGLEVVVAGVLAGDDVLLSDMLTGDMHRQSAANIFGVAPEDVTPDQRRLAKSGSFTLMFVGSPPAMVRAARMRGQSMTLQQAKDIQFGFYNRYRGLQQMHQQARVLARNSMSRTITLPTGIKRQLMAANGSLTPQRIVNTLVQGTAAAGIKHAMMYAKKAGLSPYLGCVIHDELLGWCPTHMAEECKTELERCMVSGMQEVLDGYTVMVDGNVDQRWH